MKEPATKKLRLRAAGLLAFAVTVLPAYSLTDGSGSADLETALDGRELAFILEDLQDNEVSTRRGAVRVLARAGGAQAVGPLISALDDWSDMVRAEAARGLGQLQSHRAVPPLVACLEDDSRDVRQAVAEALGKIGSRDAIDPLLGAVGDADPGVRAAAAFSLELLGVSLGSLLRTALEGSGPERTAALAQLSGSTDDRTLEPLVRALGSWTEEVRSAAAEAIGTLGDRRVVPELLEILETGSSNARSAAADALGRLGDERAVEPLLQALASYDPETRLSVINALRSLGDPRAREPLTRLLIDGRAEIREAAATALESLGQPLGRVFLNTLAGSEEAAQAIADLGDPNVHDLLMGALETLPGSRDAAALALVKVADERTVPLLIRLLRHDSVEIRRSATRALGMLEDSRAVMPLIDVLEGDLLSIRPTVAEALGRIGDPRAVDALLPMLGDKDEVLRQAARAALHELDEPLGELIYELLETGETRKARKTLRELNDSRALGPLVRALEGPEGPLRNKAAFAMPFVELDEEATTLLIRLLNDRTNWVRIAAADALRNAKGPAVSQALLAALEHWDVHTRRTALGSLAALGERSVWTHIEKALQSSDPKIRSGAVNALAELNDPAGVDHLLTALTDDSAEVRLAAGKALRSLGEPIGPLLVQALEGTPDAVADLAGLGDPRTETVLLGALSAKDPEVRRAATRALGTLGGTRLAVERLVGIARGWAPYDRLLALSALMRMPAAADSPAPGILLRILVSPASLVYTAALILITVVVARVLLRGIGTSSELSENEATPSS